MKAQPHSLAMPASIARVPRLLLKCPVSLWAALGLLAVYAFGLPPAHAAATEAWVQRYNRSANGDDQAIAVAVDGNGNVVVTGSSGDFPIYDFYTAKYAAADGALLWEQRYNGPANNDDRAQAVAVDGSGNVLVTGYSYNTNLNADFYTAKYAAADGSLLWEQRYNGPATSTDAATAVAVDGSGNVVVTGYSNNTSFNYNFYTAKYAAADGALLWEKRDIGPADISDGATAVAVDDSGNVVVTGYSYNASINTDYYTAKYAAANGELLWEHRYNGPANGSDGATAVAVDGSGNVVVTGNSAGSETGDDYYTTKYAAANGALLWEQRYSGPTNSQDQATALAVDGSGNVVVAGYSGDFPNFDYYTVKYAASNGALLWEQRYNGLANSNDRAAAVAVDDSGNVVVTGSSDIGAPNNYNDYYTVKYAAADGALLWEQRYNGPANGDDRVGASHCLALGPNGMVAVTGSAEFNFDFNTTYDYATVVYWEKLPPFSITPDGIGGYFIRGSGTAGVPCQLQRATSVAGPWQSNATIVATSLGFIEFHDTNPPPGQAVYRAVQP